MEFVVGGGLPPCPPHPPSCYLWGGGGGPPPPHPPWALRLNPAPGRAEPSWRLLVLWNGGLLQPTGLWKKCACGSHAPAAVELQATRSTCASSETRHESSKSAGPLSRCRAFGTGVCCNQLGGGNSVLVEAMHLLLWSCKPPDAIGRRPKPVAKVQKPPVR